MQTDIRGGEWSRYFSENSFRFNAVYLPQDKERAVAVPLNSRDLDLKETERMRLFSLVKIRFKYLTRMVLFHVNKGLEFPHPFLKNIFLRLQTCSSRICALSSREVSLYYTHTCACVCIHIDIHIYVCTHTHIYTHKGKKQKHYTILKIYMVIFRMGRNGLC